MNFDFVFLLCGKRKTDSPPLIESVLAEHGLNLIRQSRQNRIVEQGVQSGKQQAAENYGNNHADYLIQIKFAAFVFCDRLDRGLFSAYPRLDFSEHGSSLEVNFERPLHSHICHQLLFGIYI